MGRAHVVSCRVLARRAIFGRVGDIQGWMVQLERLSTFVRAAPHNGDEKGAPMCPNALASSLGSEEKVVKEGKE